MTILNARLDRRVEFVGLCGAGKSTFYALLQDKLAQCDLPLVEQRPTAVPPLRALIAGAQFSSSMAVSGRGLPFLFHSENWWLPLKLGYRNAQMRRGVAATPHWQIQIDTGLLQPIVSFAAEHNWRLDPVPLAAILPKLDLPRILIYLQATAPLALARYVAREKPDAQTSSRLERQFVQAYDVCEAVVEKCRMAGTTVVKVDARDSRSDEAAGRVAEMLCEHIGVGTHERG
jgi:hypothetical protein